MTDSGNYRIQKFTSDGDFIRKWGVQSAGDNHNTDNSFGGAAGVAVDSDDNNYVADSVLCVVKKFDRNGVFIKKWGSEGTGDGQFMRPWGIATFSGNSLLVADYFNHRIQEFSTDGDFITKWGMHGNRPSQFNGPTFIGINKTTSMHYISDISNHRIQKFSWDPGIVGPFPDEIQEKLERFSISENKTQKDIVIEALKHYLKS